MRYRVSYLMDEIWERAVETALEGEKDDASTRTLTLDGAVKCVQGRLPPPSLLERFENLQHLSIANVGVSSLEQFPRLRSLQKLNLSDNRIAGGLEFLVQAGLDSLRDLDLSNNRIQFIEDLAPLAEVRLVSLDLYECPVTRVKDYRSRVFGLIKSLRFLDKMDADGNERPESDDEEEEEEEEEEGEEEDDPGSGEIDGEEDRGFGVKNGHVEGADGVVDADDDEESDADEEEVETSRGRVNGGSNHVENGFRVAPAGGDDVEEEDDEDDSGEEIDEEGGDDEDDDDDDVVEVHEIVDSDDDDEDGVEFDEDDDDEDDEEEEVDNDEGDFAEPESTGRLTSTEGEIDGHEQGEEDGDDDDIGETGEDEMGIEEDDGEFEDDDEEDDYGGGYLVQPVAQSEALNTADVADVDDVNENGEEEEEEEVDDDDDDVQVLPAAATSSHPKRKRDDDADDSEEEDEDDEDVVAFSKPSKKHH
ncbi:acidic leucine-rich nuclear phosphoprotein 32-related protein [Lotus japonicus]|uniref:acidic leucine-rich nuclear phosphoprotein 32-related protein n=1 Tax=Lotus japonicus TaxID=34305 RepID=UPI002589BD39|nr:acidic leucine-rich nuclear phosphoprotein 32-related protein [Lotus japonicus]